MAAFARLALELLRLGAPSELVEDVHRAALDEVHHARMATSLDNMSPSNVFIRALNGIPLAPGVAEHSIVAVRGTGSARRLLRR